MTGEPDVVPEELQRAALLTAPVIGASFSAVDFSTGFLPPDVAGAAGPNHLVAVHNGVVRIQN
jgi:hypothetical protein